MQGKPPRSPAPSRQFVSRAWLLVLWDRMEDFSDRGRLELTVRSSWGQPRRDPTENQETTKLGKR
eukprot:1518273-Rhodomonas_salina.3